MEPRAAPSRIELLVGADAFWNRCALDMAAARERVLVQAMTFEGDTAGLAVAAAIGSSPATDRRVLVDDYTRHVVNDTFLALTRDAVIHAEATATDAMMGRLGASGAAVRVTNPIGRNPLRYARRNHKKLVVIDGVAWLGGVNFSDHNFAWHDMMVRIADPAVADWLAGQFDRDWRGEGGSAVVELGEELLLSLDGADNPAGFAPLLAAFAGARQSLEVVSAYPTFPFVDAMGQAARAGAQVTLYTPRPNNKPIIRDYLLGVAERVGIEIRLTPMMTHAKAALIDGAALVVGSSNFDFVSYRANAEYVAVLHDAGLIAAFRAGVLEPLAAGSTPPAPCDRSAFRSWRARLGLGLADRTIGLIAPGLRIADWPVCR